MADNPSPNTTPPIIIKKVSGHGGHHGGAWKVAYADFVTALMALFIVLWLVNTSKPVRDAVSGYFKDPQGFGKEPGTLKPSTIREVEDPKGKMDALKKKLEEAMKRIPELEKLKDQIEMTVTNEGLRIELLEAEKGTFFDLGSPHPTKFGSDLITVLAKEIGRLPNPVLIEGHTDARPYISDTGYSNWELSADRANSARRMMQANGLHESQVTEVRGYAAQKLRKAGDPNDASNRRISMIVKYLDGSTPGEHITTSHGTLDAVPSMPPSPSKGSAGPALPVTPKVAPAATHSKH